MTWESALLLLLSATACSAQTTVSIPRKPVGTAPPLPPGQPHDPPAYMKDNVNNFFSSAPDKGSLTGPVLASLNSSMLEELHGDLNITLEARQSSIYWLASAGSAGVSPFGPSGYTVFRNVKDFGAVGDGKTDDTAAINRAAATYGTGSSTLRCGANCGSSTTLGAVVFFPPGTYLISTPIIQYYYTQFVGDPTNKPTIKGSFNFTGIALFDSDFYIPGGNGAEWYLNQNNFYRQIRNFVFDMTGQNWTNTDNGQTYVPSGIHWQVGQATSITYCDFKMSVSSGSQSATAVGIYMENGSGGFVSDLTFTGGNIGFLAGSQQFTANNLQFTSCLTAIWQQWNWGFNWKNIYVLSCYVAIDCTSYSGITNQGTGSITVLDSHFNGVPYAITLKSQYNEQPNIVLDNLLVENSQSVVLISGGATLLPGSTGALTFNSWASGYQYLPSGGGGKRSGFLSSVPSKPANLLGSGGAYFTRSKPQYAGSSPVIATSHGVKNDGTGDQTSAINSLLSGNVGSLIFFPAGIYMVQGTVKVPLGSIITGSAWSQIMASGSYFSDATNPKVMVQVGNPGDSGVIEISDMLFTVQGATAGCILMEWNVHESSQGSAAMWDSHFRVGGAAGTHLQLSDCPTGGTSVKTSCMAATMLLHVTTQSSGYFENVWAWTADHDLDNAQNAQATESIEGIPQNIYTQISIYSGRGILIESQGPTWLYGTSSEHNQLYQYQISNASNIYLGHLQSETPYYQPNPNALTPYKIGQYVSDPTFSNCADDSCKTAWALRVVDSEDIFVYAAGFYSFFQNNQLGCATNESCQLALIQTNFANLWAYNIFTKGGIQVISPLGGIDPVFFNSTTKDGYTSEIAAWLALAYDGEDIGDNPGDGSGYVTIDPTIYSEPTASVTVSCFPPCTYVMPPLTLPSNTTFIYPPLTTSLEVGWNTTISGTVTFVSTIETTVITVPPVTTSVISVYDVTVTANTTLFYLTPSIIAPPFTITDDTTVSISGQRNTAKTTETRTFYPPPWPFGGTAPATTTSSSSNQPGGGPTPTSHDTHFPPVHHTSGAPNPICTHPLGCGHHCIGICHPCWLGCPGLPGLNWWDPGDPNAPSGPGDGDPDDECETSTFSSCSSTCTITTGPPTTATQTCSTTCHTTIGCDSSDTEDGSETTLSCPAIPAYTPWYTTDTQLAPVLGDGGFGGTVVYGTMTPPPFESQSVVTIITVVTSTVTPPRSTVTSTVTVTPTTTTQTVVPPTGTAYTASCAYWEAGFFLLFEVYNIQGWSNDHGSALHKQEGGCGALTGWDWHDASSTEAAYVYFNLPVILKAGCVERAIVSAGGPKISCQYKGLGSRRLTLDGPENDLDHDAWSDQWENGWDEETADYVGSDGDGQHEGLRIRREAYAAEQLRRRAEHEHELAKRTITSDTASYKSPTTTYTVYTSPSSSASYTPANWTGSNATLTLTWTFTSTTDIDTWYTTATNATTGVTTYTTTETITTSINSTTSTNSTVSSTSKSSSITTLSSTSSKSQSTSTTAKTSTKTTTTTTSTKH